MCNFDNLHKAAMFCLNLLSQTFRNFYVKHLGRNPAINSHANEITDRLFILRLFFCLACENEILKIWGSLDMTDF